MKPADPFAVVKECKGVALSILVLLATNQQLGGGAVTQEWLERHSGYTDKPVSQALAYLSETGRIRHTQAGWLLAGNPAAPALPPAGAFHAPQAAVIAGKEEQTDEAPSVGAGRELSDSPTASAAIDPLVDPIRAEAEVKGVGIIPTHANLEHVEANLAAFKKWGVGRNEKTIILCARPKVTPQQIEAIARRLISERRFSTGLLITAVQCDDQPVPDLPNKYNPRREDRDPSQYAEWER